MLQPYPTRPVVSNNLPLLASYNAHPDTALLSSQCLTSEQAISLLNNGAKFETIVCIDNDGQEVLNKIGHSDSWDIEFNTRVEHHLLDSSSNIDIDAIHTKVIGYSFMRYGMG